MRADAVDLDLSSGRVRVVCEDPKALGLLRSAMADHLSDDAAPIGFSLQAPAGKKAFYVLLDRSGFVLARVKSAEEGLAVLGSHLAAWTPAPPDTVRIHARAFLGADSRVALAGFPAFVDPPVVERQLERASQRLIDRLALDITLEGELKMTATPWQSLARLPVPGGHAAAPLAPTAISRVILPSVGGEEASTAQAVAFLAQATFPTATRQDRLTLAERLSAMPRKALALDERAARYESLRQ